MSTRACIAQTTGKDSWQGVYSQRDGYPSGLGKKIWDILHRDFIGNRGCFGVQNSGDPKNAVRAFCDVYITGHPAGWSSLESGICFCHDPGFVLRDGLRSSRISNEDNEPLFIEWVYVLNPEKVSMTIYTNRSRSKKGNPKKKIVNLGNGEWDYGHVVYWHEEVDEIDLQGEEPDWEAIEKEG